MKTFTYLDAWRSISGRIRGVERAARVHAGFLVAQHSSPYGADKDLQRHCQDISADIQGFRDTFVNQLPDGVLSAIERFMADCGKQISQNSNGDALMLRTIIVKLVAFESEITFYLDTPLERVRSAAELAFMHLQRSIVVDEGYRQRWISAYSGHETHCEKLGSVHLLWHGIWAFKVDAAGAKTDLVYQEPLTLEQAPAALGLILTEWKRATDDPDAAYAEAKYQADLYSSGVLAGLELTSHRYLVAVTRKNILPRADIVEGSVTYRHINIAVEPDSPSVAARKASS